MVFSFLLGLKLETGRGRENKQIDQTEVGMTNIMTMCKKCTLVKICDDNAGRWGRETSIGYLVMVGRLCFKFFFFFFRINDRKKGKSNRYKMAVFQPI